MAAYWLKVIAIYCAICLFILLPMVGSQAPAVTSLRCFSNRFFSLAQNSDYAWPGRAMATSPAAVAMLLALLVQGSEDETQLQMTEALFAADKNNAKSMYLDMFAKMMKSSSISITTLNKIYIMDGYTINNDFINEAGGFDTEVVNINFGDFVYSTNTINNWMNEKTNGKVTNIIVDPYSMGLASRIAVMNSLFVQGLWHHTFNDFYTRDGIFTDLVGGQRTVPMMNIVNRFKYGAIPSLDAVAVEMFFRGQEASMVFVLPNESTTLSAMGFKINENTNWRVLMKNLMFTNKVRVTIPRFRAETLLDLKRELQKLGPEYMYRQHQAHFKPISSNKQDNLNVWPHFQKIVIDINETGVNVRGGVPATRLVKPRANFNANRPFMWFIKDYHGHILFMGSYN